MPTRVVVAQERQVYFTDASTRFAPAEWGGTFEASVLDILEQSATGRVLAYDPRQPSARAWCARPGVRERHRAVSGRQEPCSSPRPANTACGRSPHGRQRPRRPPATTAGEGAARQPARLPRQPDARARREDLAGLGQAAQPTIDKLADKPFLRKVTMRLPRALWPVPKAYGHVVAFTEDGRWSRTCRTDGRLPGDDGSDRDARPALCAEPACEGQLGRYWPPSTR
jgi:hypothetical protein